MSGCGGGWAGERVVQGAASRSAMAASALPRESTTAPPIQLDGRRGTAESSGRAALPRHRRRVDSAEGLLRGQAAFRLEMTASGRRSLPGPPAWIAVRRAVLSGVEVARIVPSPQRRFGRDRLVRMPVARMSTPEVQGPAIPTAGRGSHRTAGPAAHGSDGPASLPMTPLTATERTPRDRGATDRNGHGPRTAGRCSADVDPQASCAAPCPLVAPGGVSPRRIASGASAQPWTDGSFGPSPIATALRQGGAEPAQAGHGRYGKRWRRKGNAVAGATDAAAPSPGWEATSWA